MIFQQENLIRKSSMNVSTRFASELMISPDKIATEPKNLSIFNVLSSSTEKTLASFNSVKHLVCALKYSLNSDGFTEPLS